MEKYKVGGKIEKKENEVFSADLRVDFIRHGQAVYSTEEKNSNQFEGKLDEKGKKQIEETAEKIAEEIAKKDELVLIWSSPKSRALESSDILKKIFKEKGVLVLENNRSSKVGSLKDIHVSSDFKVPHINNWMEYWSEHEDEIPEGTERPKEVRKRVERMITYLERIARKVHPADDRKIHVICMTHEEMFRDLLEEGFNFGTEKETGPENGELLRIDIEKQEHDKNAVLELEYRKTKQKLEFDKNNRSFQKVL